MTDDLITRKADGWSDDREVPRSRAELTKQVQNALADPRIWDALGFGDLPVDRVAAYCRDRASYVVKLLLGPT